MSHSIVLRHIGRLTTWAGPVATAAAMIVREGRVAWTGADDDLPAGVGDLPEFDVAGAAVIPGFVDAHTHAVFAGDRIGELAARVAGESYAAGGIRSTVSATRAATDTDLLALTAGRLLAMRRGGTTTVEIKSGYALTPPGEQRLLRVAREAARAAGVRAETTYLGAHVVPEGRSSSSYADEVVTALPDAVAVGAHWCDVFCDTGAFTVEETRRILTAARAVGLGLRMHADQLARTGAAELAAELGCTSADHLEQIDERGAEALAAAGVVAVLAPVAGLQTAMTGSAHYERLRDAGATIAIASDCNPGTAWTESMPLAIQLACWMWGMPVDAALRAATLGGAAALNRQDIGHLGIGAWADLVVLDADHEAELAVHLRGDPAAAVLVGGLFEI